MSLTDLVKKEEKLPAVKPQTELEQTIKDASTIEIIISSAISWYVVTELLINFGLASVDKRQHRTIDTHLVDNYRMGENFRSMLGGFVGVSAAMATEAVLIYFLENTGIGIGAYLGMKVLTNTAGYFYYKRQREKHKLLEQYVKPLIGDK